MTNLDAMTASELRAKLLEHGYDIPSSISKDFMVKKLKKAMAEGKKKTSTTPGPQSTGAGRKTPPRNVDPPRAVVRPTAPEKTSVLPTTPPRTTRMSASRNTRQSVGANNNNDVTDEPQRRTTPARRGGLNATRHSIATISRNRTPPRTTLSSSRREIFQQNDDDDDEDDEEPMSQDSGGGIGSWSQPQQQPTLQMPTRSSLRPSPLKRARPSDSPTYQTHSLFGNATTDSLMSSMDSSGFVKRQSSTLSYSSPPPVSSKGRFGLIVNGRKVQTDCIPNDELNPKKFIFNIPDADSVQYIVVFLPESEQFIPGTAAQIYVGWPDERNEIKWHMLGHISNIRPSAIFNISDFKQAIVPAAGNLRFSFGVFSGNNAARPLTGPTNAQIGISIESLEVIASSTHPQVQL